MKKINELNIILIFLLGTFDLISQDGKYYKNFNYAYEILTTNKNNREISEADSIFEYLFNESENHHLEEVIKVVNQRSRQNNEHGLFYINTLVKVAKKYKYYKRETNMPLLTRHEFNLIKKELDVKDRQKKRTLHLVKMILTDRKARKKRQNINLADSLNAVKVKEILADTSLIRDLTYTNKAMLELLITHGGIKYYKQDLDLIRYYVGEKRYLSRTLLHTLIERDAVFGGKIYKIINDELIPIDNENQKICAYDDTYNFFYSNIGEMRFYRNQKQVFVPINPNLSLEEINQIRSYCFLPDYSQKTNELYVYPNATEWCEIVNYDE